MRLLTLVGTLALAASLMSCNRAPANSGAGGYRVPVETIAATLERVEDKLTAVGTLEPNEMVQVKSEVAARVTEIFFEEGSAVSVGEVLFQLDDAKLQAELLSAEAQFEKARNNLERGRTLLEQKTISPQEFDDIQADFKSAQAALALAKKRLDDATVRSPLDGAISRRLVSPGKYVETGETLVIVVDNNPMKIDFGIPERFLPQVRVGQTVNVTVPALPASVFTGEVYFVDPVVETTTRTVKIRALIPNPDAELRAGMFANVELLVGVRPQAVVVPEQAVVPQIDKLTVFVVDDGVARRRTVKLGTRLPGKVEIVEGISAGEQVVIAGQQKLRDQVPVQPVAAGS